MKMIMSENGSTLISRVEGAKIREEVLGYIKHKEEVILNFEGITRITQSFSDELFGKILYDINLDTLKCKVKILNASADIEKIIKFSIRHRISMMDNSYRI